MQVVPRVVRNLGRERRGESCLRELLASPADDLIDLPLVSRFRFHISIGDGFRLVLTSFVVRGPDASAPRATGLGAESFDGLLLLVEAGRELLDDAVREHVRHAERLEVDLVVGGDVGGPVALNASDRFVRRQTQVLVQHRLHLVQAP